MDVQRAQEIANSAQMHDVSYNGKKIYIEHVDRSSGQATIHPLDDKETKLSVAINELLEQ